MLAAAGTGRGARRVHDGLSPCMLSYGWIFGELIRRSPEVENTPYWPFVRDYAGNRYDAICRAWSEFTDQACQDLAPGAGKKVQGDFPRLLPP